MGRIWRIRKLLVIVVIAGILLFAQTGYVLVRPGSAEDLAGFVTVEGGDKDHEGVFFLVTVTQQNASPLLWLYGLVNPIVDLQSKREVIPPNMDREEYSELMQQWMKESQNLAKVIALKEFGIDVPIESDGVEVVDVGEDSPAEGILQPDDVILEVDGEPVFLAEELVTQVQLREIGDPVSLKVLRDRELLTVTIPTTTHVDQAEKAAIRVLIQTLNWQPQLPVDIDIQVGEITGPSAGLMFVLEILNQLDPRDLTSGVKVAGTGTINLREEVGAIGGVRQKVRAAEKAGAVYFLVPIDNYEDAQAVAQRIQLVPVETLDEAVRFLDELETN
jgi:PDZ domain-containing protein